MVLTMRLLVLGATGRTGRELLAGALYRGHEVTALVRDPGRLSVRDAGLRVLVGGATDPAMLEQAVEGQDAVVSALGPRSVRELVRSELMRSSIPALLSSMERHGVRRLILLSALGVGESGRHAPTVPRFAFGTILRQVRRDKELAEDALRASQIDWTIVYPPALTDAPGGGGYRHGESLKLSGAPRINRSDVAHFMLAQVTDERYIRKGAIVGR
jgi:putative NADH-flavin reductase